MTASAANRTGIFISYSHKDQKWLKQLQVHLTPLRRDQDIDFWDDTKIEAGSKWRQGIRGAIQQAKAAVLLISPNFMASDFIAQSELPSILAAAEADGLIVLPLILRPSRFDRDERLSQFQTVNSPSQPLIDMATGKRDVVFEKLAETIEDLLCRPAPHVEAAELRGGGAASDDVVEKLKRGVHAREGGGRKSKARPAPEANNKLEPPAIRREGLIRSPRIYVSAPFDRVLNHQQREIKREVLHAISQAGLQPQEFGVSGLPARLAWDFYAANEVMSNCQGALVLALIRFRASTESGPIAIPTESNHFEGGLAISRGLPTLVLAEHGIQERGIAYPYGGQQIVTMPESADRTWLKSSDFAALFQTWCDSVKSRNHVFLGYSGAMRETAAAIGRYLNSLGVSVIDPLRDFQSGQSLKAQVDRALSSSATSMFLFGSDDDTTVRGNLLFELGYFARAKGVERTLIICQAGAKLPTDLAGVTTILLKDHYDLTAIQAHLRAFDTRGFDKEDETPQSPRRVVTSRLLIATYEV